MFCNNCGTQYDLTPVAEGKSKFCRNCGSVLYKNENGNIIFSTGAIPSQEEENKKRFDLEKQETERQEQERINQELEKKRIQEQQENIERERIAKEQEERDKREQELKSLQAQLEKERLERERLEKEKLELEKQEKARLAKEQKEKEAAEQAKLEQEKKEKEAAEKLRLEKEQKDREIQEQVRIALEKIKQEEAEKAASLESAETAPESGRGTLLKYTFIVLALCLLTGLAAYFYFPDKVLALLGKQPASTGTSAENTPAPVVNTDSILLEQIRNDLAGNEVLSWGPVQLRDIQSLALTDKTEDGVNINYKLTVELDDLAGTRAVAELGLTYEKIVLSHVTTQSITYKNTAPANAWFSFQPVPDCTIMVNTNGNTIQAKSCNNCPAIAITSSKENPTRLTNSQNIFITSGGQADVVVDFTYQPNSATP